MENNRLSPEEIKQLQEIEVVLNDIRAGNNIDLNIKKLSKKHNILKGYLQELRRPFLNEKDLKYIEALNKDTWAVLEPVYNGLTEMAIEHCKQWYIRIKKEAGEVDPKIHTYQLDLIRWLLEAAIKNELTDSIYTLLISRGAGEILPINN